MAAGDAGRAISKTNIDGAAAEIAEDVIDIIERVEHFKGWLDGVGVNTPDPLPNLVVSYGYTVDGANDLKSAFSDLGELVAIFRGTGGLSVQRNFDTFVKRLRGIDAHD